MNSSSPGEVFEAPKVMGHEAMNGHDNQLLNQNGDVWNSIRGGENHIPRKKQDGNHEPECSHV